MKYTQAELRREFPVYDPLDPRFAAWLIADSVARLAWISMKSVISEAANNAQKGGI